MSVTEYVYRHEIRLVLPAGVTKLSMVGTAGGTGDALDP
jgi:hypothetical protein